MVSFRFYLVSVTAIFLALAVGITVGATVIDKATVDLLHSQIRAANRHADETANTNKDLQNQLDERDAFESSGARAFVQGRLTDERVIVAAVHGNATDEAAIENVRSLVQSAGGQVQTVLWFTSKLRLDKAEDVAALANAVGLPPGSAPDVVRSTAISRLAAALGGASGVTSPLPALLSMQMVELKPPLDDPSKLLTDRARFLVATPIDPAVPNEQLALPLVSDLVRSVGSRIVAVEAGRDAVGKQAAVREQLVGPLRADPAVSVRLSTVDDIDDIRGQVTSVYALQNLAAGTFGHYGVGPNARDHFNLSPPP